MPLLKSEYFTIDYLDVGHGPTLVLIHSAASNNKQWRQLIEDYQQQYRFLAINLFGYGKTTPWPNDRMQTISDQVDLVTALCEMVEDPVYLIGHSLGGTVAAYSAMQLKEKVRGLVLLEANPFPLLAKQHSDIYQEVLGLRDFILTYGNKGEWHKVGQRFVDYWAGAGTWDKLAEERQRAFVDTLPNNLHEWHAVMAIGTDTDLWQAITAKTLLLCANETKQPIKAIYEILKGACPDWDYQELDEGGHMAPVTRPDLVNPVVIDFVKSIL